MVPTFIHIMCHNKRLLKKDGMCRVREKSPDCSFVEEEEESPLSEQSVARG